jgi:hypothetical protein
MNTQNLFFTVYGGVAGARGGGKTKIPLFGARRYCTVLYHSIVKEIVQYDTYCTVAYSMKCYDTVNCKK